MTNVFYQKNNNNNNNSSEKLIKDAMPVSFRSELFTSYILTAFKQ